MQQLFQLLVNGVALGSVYALAAIGFVIVYSATGIVNFATGQFVMLGTFFGVAAIMRAKLPIELGYLVAVAGMALFGLLFFLGVHLPLRKRPAVSVIIGTVAAGIVMQNAALLVWGPWPARLPSPFGDRTISFAGAIISAHAIATIGMTAVIILGLYVLLYRTSVGRSMRAIAQDIEAARLIGLPVTLTLIATWALAAACSAFAGLLVGPMWFADVNMGDPIALKAFAATVIGGFGSVPGAILGGVFVGLVEILGASYLTSTYKDLLAFAFMIGFLLLRPQGIFGEKIGDRG